MRIEYPLSVPRDSFAQAINIPVHAGNSFESTARAVHDYVIFELEPTGFFAATCSVEVPAAAVIPDVEHIVFRRIFLRAPFYEIDD